MVFCNDDTEVYTYTEEEVTILILIDGFLQFSYVKSVLANTDGHNPYFNRWFSAIRNH